MTNGEELKAHLELRSPVKEAWQDSLVLKLPAISSSLNNIGNLHPRSATVVLMSSWPDVCFRWDKTVRKCL